MKGKGIGIKLSLSLAKIRITQNLKTLVDHNFKKSNARERRKLKKPQKYLNISPNYCKNE